MFGAIVRFFVSAIVLWVVAMFVPGMAVAGFWGAFWAALVIAGLGWAAERLLGRNVSPGARGLTGFIIAAVVIYLTAWMFPQFLTVSVWGALIAAFVIGLIDSFVPTVLR